MLAIVAPLLSQIVHVGRMKMLNKERRTRVVVATVLIGAFAIGSGVLLFHTAASNREAAQRRECLNRLRPIDAVLNCCIPAERKLNKGDPIKPEWVAELMKHNRIPKCPSGVAFRIPVVAGGHPSCPVHGELPDDHQ